MNKWVWLLIGLVIGVVGGLFLRAKGVVTYPGMHRLHEWVHILGDGDPPVLVSDLHAYSYNGWATASDTTIVPNGATTPGTLMNTCDNMDGYGLVQFFDGVTYWDASPLSGQPLNMTIFHHGQPITAATDANHSNLTFTDPNHHWGHPSGGTVNNSADDIDAVQDIDPSNGGKVTHAAKNANAYVAFCYK
jgi:hypothetical protein